MNYLKPLLMCLSVFVSVYAQANAHTNTQTSTKVYQYDESDRLLSSRTDKTAHLYRHDLLGNRTLVLRHLRQDSEATHTHQNHWSRSCAEAGIQPPLIL